MGLLYIVQEKMITINSKNFLPRKWGRQMQISHLMVELSRQEFHCFMLQILCRPLSLK